ncbi:Protein of unknown function DUF273 family-containing protein [Strongyloides ratti]|uniref:Uncharacterized protein n=1 Tax=Strongyloides ratti TaxID=34506 RepID=A0A090LLI3_STRRB|nr:Protein of unknown function DUF273 family-containing protein [Strongyloides ratti]CEF69033.1 Protein of unknown function DUF273 family-containing protein [Strongyloides ratti]
MKILCSILFPLSLFFILFIFSLIHKNSCSQIKEKLFGELKTKKIKNYEKLKVDKVGNDKILEKDKFKNYEVLNIDKVKKKIAIVVVVDVNSIDYNKENFETIKCYSLHNSYSFVVITILSYPHLFIDCKQKSFVFQRHCVVAKFAEKYQKIFKYIIFVSENVGIINPVHKLENYLLKKNEEMIFYEKISNNEISTDSYIFKNTNYSRNFLKFFANYECSVPEMYNKNDNSAIQTVFVTLFGGDQYLNIYNHCINIWFKGTTLNENIIFESCMRWLLSMLNENEGKSYMLFDDKRVVLLGKKSKRKWIRDGKLYNWHFGYKDFFFSNWNTNKLSINNFSFKKNSTSTNVLCKSRRYINMWKYNSSMKLPQHFINLTMKNLSIFSEINYYNNLTLCNLDKIKESNGRDYLKVIYNKNK